MMKAKSPINNDFYENLLYICPEAVIVSDTEGIISFASKKIYDVQGFPSGIDIRGRSVFDFIAVQDGSKTLEDMKLMFRENRPRSARYIFLKYDGSPFNAEMTSTPVLDNDEKVTGFFSIIRDISDEMRTTEELLMKENMLDSAINGMAIAKFGGEVTYVNRSAVNMWGYENENEIKGKQIGDFWYNHQEVDELRKSLLKKNSMVTEIKGKKKNGLIFDVQMAASIIRDDKGAPVYILGSFLDITERKKAEEKIMNSLKEKEILFKEIHHRVKNNLQIVSSLINLQMQNVSDKMSTDILIDCQNRILSMAKLHESLYQSENLMYINIPDYIKNIVMHLLISYDAINKVEINVDIDNIRLGMDTAIPCGLVINEILSNSMKHGFDLEDGKNKRIDLSMKYDKDNCITLRIADNGCGIPKENLEKSRSLGMKLIFALIDQINGKVTINSELGTEFAIEFDGMENQ